MKKIISIGVFFAFFAYVSIFGQTITGNCSQVIVTNEGFIPPRTKPNDALIQVNSALSFSVLCKWTAIGFEVLPNVRFILERRNNNVFSFQSSQDNNPTFSNLSSGTYRVRIQHFLEEQGNCINLFGVSNAQRPLGIEDLRQLWNPNSDPNWAIVPGNTYRVQVTISNSNCASWVDNLQTFLLCYPSWGCREGVAHDKIEPTMSPNPVSQSFKVEGIDFNPVLGLDDELNIYDLTGRLVKSFKTIQYNEFNVSDLTTGVYFVSVLRDEHKLFTKKLIVSR
jgi:hypothetical protein